MLHVNYVCRRTGTGVFNAYILTPMKDSNCDRYIACDMASKNTQKLLTCIVVPKHTAAHTAPNTVAPQPGSINIRAVPPHGRAVAGAGVKVRLTGLIVQKTHVRV